MGFIRFYMRVIYEAFRHSLDITQTIFFIMFILAVTCPRYEGRLEC
jgi:hypothetical protein